MAKFFPLKTGVSYFGNYFLGHFKRDLKTMVRGGCNFIVLTFSELDLQYYRGTMKDMVKASQDAGLEVYLDPWGIGRVFGGESYSEFLVRQPQTCQVSSTGKRLPIACLNHPLFQDFLMEWCEAGFEFKIDYFFWDEPHFHLFKHEEREKGLWSCRCPVCQKQFEQKFGKQMPKTYTAEVRLFRESSVVRFLKKFCNIAKKEGFRNAVCLLPDIYSQYAFRDWEKVAAIKTVDVFGTDPYWHFGVSDVATFVRGYARRVVALSRKYRKEPQIWILNFRIRKGKERDISLAIRAAYEEGIRNFAAWSYWGTGQMSYLRSDNPNRVWQTLSRAYRSLHKGRFPGPARGGARTG